MHRGEVVELVPFNNEWVLAWGDHPEPEGVLSEFDEQFLGLPLLPDSGKQRKASTSPWQCF